MKTILLVCAATTIINKTTTWTKHDEGRLNYSKERCKIVYPDSPCLTKFIKIESARYMAVCGKPNAN